MVEPVTNYAGMITMDKHFILDLTAEEAVVLFCALYTAEDSLVHTGIIEKPKWLEDAAGSALIKLSKLQTDAVNALDIKDVAALNAAADKLKGD